MINALGLIPKGNLKYPDELMKRREELAKDMIACKDETNIIIKLQLLSRAFRLFSDQTIFENTNKLRMMAIYERDRLKRLGVEIPNDRKVDKLQSG